MLDIPMVKYLGKILGFDLFNYSQTDERVKQPTGTGQVDDGRSSNYLSSDVSSQSSSSYQGKKNQPGRRRRHHRFVSSILSESTADDGCRQMLERPPLRPNTISQRSHLMPIISSHHTVVFIIVTLLHSLFTTGRRWSYRLFAVIENARLLIALGFLSWH